MWCEISNPTRGTDEKWWNNAARRREQRAQQLSHAVMSGIWIWRATVNRDRMMRGMVLTGVEWSLTVEARNDVLLRVPATINFEGQVPPY